MMDSSPLPDAFMQPPVQPEVVGEPTAPSRRKRSLLGRLLWSFLVLALLSSLAANLLLFVAIGVLGVGSIDEDRVQEKFVSGNRSGPNKVAILSIEGTILSTEGFFRQQIDHARRDAATGDLKAIVVRVNSPGGTITGSDYMLHHLRKLADDHHIPLVVSMGDLAASGGYYVSMCVGDTEDAIFAEPTTWTGSIGVVIPHYNLADLMGKWGIADDSVASNPLKTMGSLARKMTPHERDIFQALVNDGFTRFKDVIKEGRPRFRRDPAALDVLATGQVFTANQALAAGLVDRIGFIEDVVDRAVVLAGIDKASVKVVKYKAEPRLSEMLFGRSKSQASVDLAALLAVTTPRAYYLCTWLPALVSSAE
ncbi:MAG: signal peptide peptidase SppA [Thermoguttaceae bacterium]